MSSKPDRWIETLYTDADAKVGAQSVTELIVRWSKLCVADVVLHTDKDKMLS